MLHSRYFKYEKTKPVFGAPIANYIMRMPVNKCLRLYDHSEQACTGSKDQIKLKLFSCAKVEKKCTNTHHRHTYATELNAKNATTMHTTGERERVYLQVH